MNGEIMNSEVFKDLYGDLMEFADRISMVVGGPVTIEDAGHRLLAYSMHEENTDQARIATIIGRRVPEKVVNSLWNAGIIPALLEGNTAIKVDAIEGVGLGSRAAVSIRKNSEVLGFIWALEGTKPFTDRDLAFLQFAAKEAKNQLQQHQLKKKRREAGTQEYLWRLLTGHYRSETEAQEQLPSPLKFPSFHAAAVFDFPEEITGSMERNISYMLTVTQKTSIFLYTIDQNQLIILAGSEQESPLSKELNEFIPYFCSEMSRRFQTGRITGAGGSSYSLPLESRYSYEEALYTLKMKQIYPEDTERVFLYEELGIYQYLQVIAENSRNRREHHALKQLEYYDHKHQTDLLHTLKIYLEKDGNHNAAARQLHIHPNTLNYRLKRISDIGRIDFKDTPKKMQLFLDLKIRDYLKHLP